MEEQDIIEASLTYVGVSRHEHSCHPSVKVNLVDPASSRMLLSRAKPCKSQSKRNNSGSANGSLYQR
jgi:hypothetical protein